MDGRAEVHHGHVDEPLDGEDVGRQFVVALAAAFALHAHAHAPGLFSDGEVLDIAHVFCLRDELDVVLFDLLACLHISECPCGEGIDMVKAICWVGGERDPAFVVEARYLMGVLVSHSFFSLIL